MSDNRHGAEAEGTRATLVVTPRERFGMARQSLESIYAARSMPFELVYVDARSPQHLSEWVAKQAKIHGFTHLQVDRFLSPNEARNFGMRKCKTPYVVFIDNDVVCADDWLDWLVRCADETGADVVAPLVCEGQPLHSRVHQAGGKFAEDVEAFFGAAHGDRVLIDVMRHQGLMIDQAKDDLTRTETQTCEFHCVLVRRSIFDRIGPLDEEMLATKEHLDFCMSVIHAGGKVMFEPNSVVTYVFPNRKSPLAKEDIPYFLLRWSADWQSRSFDRLQHKWGLKGEGVINVLRSDVHWRHFEGVVKPRLTKVPLIGRNKLWIRLGNRFFRSYLGRKVAVLSREYDEQRGHPEQATSRA